MNFQATLSLAIGATLATALTLTPSHADACGGFFCNNAQPVNQQAERIIFHHGEDGSVTAVIQIQYQGPSEEFAWMLPVAGTPEVAVSSNAAFQRIQQASNPQYTLTTTVEGNCGGGGSRFGPTADSAGSEDPSPAADGGMSPVTVADSGQVGPYDYVTIEIDPGTADKVAVAVEWLQGNGYDVPDMGSDVLRPYLESGMNLLAFRLTKGNDAGSIRPVRLSFGPGLPSIPLRPTAIATQPDMGIMVWVLGETRAIPANYRHLELNEALINWLNPSANYDDVVTRAANEAGGQGFVTEQAGPAAPLGEAIWQDFEASQWESVATSDWSGREGQLLWQMQSFLQLDGVREALEAHVPVPAGLDEDTFFGCLSCYVDSAQPDIEGFEPAAFIDQVQSDAVDPMVDTQELFESAPYSTRMYTTMSADEMTVDPIFDFNADLGDYSNQHNADRIIECSPSISQFEAPWRIELEDGTVVRGNGNSWPFSVDDAGMPANARIVRVGPEGTGEVVADNTGEIAAALSSHNTTVPGPPSGGICSVSGRTGQGAAGFLLALMVGLIGVRRRKS
jgi:MYXO-CTERM domain-containing protein